MNKPIISVDLYPPHEMAEVRHGEESIFLGNTWDFHPGCHGEEIVLKHLGRKVTIPDFSGPRSLANKIAKEIDGTVEVNILDKPIPI